MGVGREAKLIMRLVDQVSAPARAIASSMTMVNAATRTFGAAAMMPARTLTALGRSARRSSQELVGLSAPMSLLGGVAARQVYEYEKAGNRMQAFGLLSEEHRAGLERTAQELNRSFPHTNQMILEAAGELFRAGLKYDQVLGSLAGSLQLSLAGDISTQKAADIATNIMYAMKLPMETSEQIGDSLKRVNDALAYAATRSNTDIQLMGDTFRYVAPLAAVAGMELEEVTAVSMKLANAGIKGSEAGVALRSALVRMAKPTRPMLAALERLNINIADFIDYKERIESETIVGSLLPLGIDAAEYRKQIQEILDDPLLAAAPTRMSAQLTDLIVGAVGDEAVRSEVAETMQEAVLTGAQRVDFRRLMRTLREKGATISDISRIFDVRMGSRLASILYDDIDAAVDQVKREYRGTANEMSRIMMRGIVGSLAEFLAALENFFIALSDSGVLATVADSMGRFTQGLRDLSKANPRLLELGTYGAIALAVMGPLGLMLSGTAAALGFLLNPLVLVGAAFATLVGMNFGAVTGFLEAFNESFLRRIDPGIVRRVKDLSTAVRDFFSRSISPRGMANLRQVATEMGVFASRGLNSLWRAMPRLRELGQSFGSFVQSNILPRLSEELRSFGSSVREFATSKLVGLKEMGNSLVSLAERAQPLLTPAFSSGIALVGQSFQTMAAGFRAVLRVVGGVSNALVAFATAMFENIDSSALASVGNGLTSVFNGIAAALRPLESMFNGLNVEFSTFASQAGALAGQGVSAVLGAFGPFVESVGGMINQIISFIERLAGIASAAATALSNLWGTASAAPRGISVGGGAPSAGAAQISRSDDAHEAMQGMVAEEAKKATPRARGGPVAAGRPYLVGERGPELRIFGKPGHIYDAETTAGMLGASRARVGAGALLQSAPAATAPSEAIMLPQERSSSVTHNHTHHWSIRSVDPKATASEVMRVLDRRLARSRQIDIDGRFPN